MKAPSLARASTSGLNFTRLCELDEGSFGGVDARAAAPPPLTRALIQGLIGGGGGSVPSLYLSRSLHRKIKISSKYRPTRRLRSARSGSPTRSPAMPPGSASRRSFPRQVPAFRSRRSGAARWPRSPRRWCNDAKPGSSEQCFSARIQRPRSAR